MDRTRRAYRFIGSGCSTGHGAFKGPAETAMSSICGIDIALWDLLGQSAGLPVWRLLGGHSNAVPVYADGIGYEDEDADRMAEKVALHSGLGFSHVKIHLPGPDPDENVEKVRRSREALGPDKKLLARRLPSLGRKNSRPGGKAAAGLRSFLGRGAGADGR